MKRGTLVVLIGLVIALTVATARPVQAIDKMQPKVLAAFRDVVSGASLSTVRVLSEGKQIALGTIVSADGYIATKSSELKDKLQVQLHDGRKVEARLVGTQRDIDLALLKADVDKLTVAPWAVGPAPTIGSWLATPDLRKEPVSIGVVSVAPRTIPAPSGALGIQLDADEGAARINSILKPSAAEKAGLQVGDVILSVNSKEVKGRRELVETIRTYQPDERVELLVERGKEQLKVTAVLGSLSQIMHGDRSEFQASLGGPLSVRRGGFTQALQHDSVLAPKECGGPLVDLEGKVVGINIARASRVETFALTTSVVRPIIEQLIEKASEPTVPPAETVQTSVK